MSVSTGTTNRLRQQLGLTNPEVETRLNGVYHTATGFVLDVEVSPCSWMYDNYGLQIGYRAQDGSSWGFVNRKALTCEGATLADVQTMVDSLPAGECTKCGRPHLVNANGNRGTTCEACFMQAIDAELAKYNAARAKREEKADAKAKRDGFTHKTLAWVHPSRGGDDYEVVMYTRQRPKKADVEQMLRKKGSAVLNDYHILKL